MWFAGLTHTGWYETKLHCVIQSISIKQLANKNNEHKADMKTYDILAAELQLAIDSQVEYVTEHCDSGANYTENFSESWSKTDSDRLKAYLIENEIEIPSDFERFENDLFFRYVEPKQGHEFSTPNRGGFDLYTAAIQEIEVQFDNESLMDLLEIGESELTDFLEMADGDFVVTIGKDDCLFYESTSCTWIAHVTLEDIKTAIEDL